MACGERLPTKPQQGSARLVSVCTALHDLPCVLFSNVVHLHLPFWLLTLCMMHSSSLTACLDFPFCHSTPTINFLVSDSGWRCVAFMSAGSSTFSLTGACLGEAVPPNIVPHWPLEDHRQRIPRFVIRRYLERSILKKLFCHLQSLQIKTIFQEKKLNFRKLSFFLEK